MFALLRDRRTARLPRPEKSMAGFGCISPAHWAYAPVVENKRAQINRDPCEIDPSGGAG